MSYSTFFENLAVIVPTADGRPSLSGGLLYRPMHGRALEDFFIGVNRNSSGKHLLVLLVHPFQDLARLNKC